MRIPHYQLAQHLKTNLAPIYLVFGTEPLLVEESTDAIRGAGRTAGFDERIRLTAESGFDWSELSSHSQALSLFSQRKLIELRLPTGKPGDAGAKSLIEYSKTLSTDNLLVVIAGNIDKRGQNSAWFKALEKTGTTVEARAIKPEQIGKWIGTRLRDKGVRHDQEAVNQLAYFVEGNLLAAAQEIDKIALLIKDKRLTADLLEHLLIDYARFNVYSLVDACLAGQVSRSQRILHSLRREGVEPILVLWALARDTRNMTQMAAAVEAGQPIAAVMRANRVWSSRTGLVGQALKRIEYGKWLRILSELAQADRVLKGRAAATSDIWHQFERVGLAICGIQPLAAERNT